MAYEELNPITEKVLGAAVAVHKALGPGFTERIYATAFEVELRARKISFASEKPIRIKYKDVVLGQHRLDLLVEDAIVVELKAVYEINHFHIAQMLSYLKASAKPLGLILNFARSRIEIKRVVV